MSMSPYGGYQQSYTPNLMGLVNTAFDKYESMRDKRAQTKAANDAHAQSSQANAEQYQEANARMIDRVRHMGMPAEEGQREKPAPLGRHARGRHMGGPAPDDSPENDRPGRRAKPGPPLQHEVEPRGRRAKPGPPKTGL